MTTIEIGSLFSGIGGLELGLEAALAEAEIMHRIVYQVEIDPYCRAVLAQHWPDADRSTTDVRHAFHLPLVDILLGGFPCQDVSGAGKGAGLAGDRSGLWYAYRDVIATTRPSIVVVENVASGKRRWLCEVRGHLHELGYRTRALQIGAADVGAPHRRERVFVVAYGNGVRQPEPEGYGRKERRWVTDICSQEPRHVALTIGEGRHLGRRPRGDGAGGVQPKDDSPVVNANGARPQIRQVQRGGPGPEHAPAVRTGLLGDADVPRRPRPRGHGLRDERGKGAAPQPGHGIGQAQRDVGRGPDGLPAGVDHTLPARWPAGRGAAQHDWEPPRTIQGREDGRRARLRALGNAVVPAVAREVARVAIVPILKEWLAS